jgi:uncharacterized protein YbjT (DUF2867 family)
MNNHKKVLVAGIGGVLGRELLENLLKLGAAVSGLAVSAKEFEGIQDKLGKSYVVDVTKPESLKGVCDGVDIVISVIGITRLKGKLTHHDVDHQGNANLLVEAKRAGVRKFVFISPAGTDIGAKQGVPLMEAKFRFEEELKNSGLEWVIVRAGGFMKDFAEMAKMAKTGPMYVIGDGQVVSTPIDVKELARFMADDALNRSKVQVDIGGPEDMTWIQICEACFELWGKRPQIIHIPVWTCHATLWILKFLAPREYALGKMVLFFSLNSVPTARRGTRTLKAYLTEYYGHRTRF